MARGFSPWGATALLGVLAAPALLLPAGAQGVAREHYDFEQDPQGFTAILVKDGAFNLDPNGGLSVVTAKEQVKSGSGTLAWSYKPEPSTFRALVAEAKIPAGAARVELWVKCTAQTALILTAREMDGSSYQLPFHVPAHEWTKVAANLDELVMDENGTDENDRLDLDQVNSLGLFDIANLLVNAGELGAQPDLRNPRTTWVDDLRFANERAPQSSGVAKDGARSAVVIDNFEGEIVRWVPIKVTIADALAFEVLPANTSLKLQKEAAGPGMARTPVEAGGRGLRFTYNRGQKDLFALYRSGLERVDLSKADRLRLSLRISQKSVVIVGIKEKDGSEYSHTISPEMSEGWQSLDLALSDFTLGGDSKDENNGLDAAQIKEISIVDASPFAGTLGTGETTIELDGVSFSLK